MRGRPILMLAGALALVLPLPAQAVTLAEAGALSVSDGYATSTGPAARTGAAYFVVANGGDAPDRLVAVEGDVAQRIELHDHVLENGIARMVKQEDGIPVPAGETVALQQGGLHVMLMGLAGPLPEGGAVPLTLVFEQAGRVDVALPVGAPDPAHGAGHEGH